MPEQKPKRVLVVFAGSGKEPREVEILPRVTVRELLQQLGIVGYVTKSGDPAPLADGAALYSHVSEGDKLIVTLKTDVA